MDRIKDSHPTIYKFLHELEFFTETTDLKIPELLEWIDPLETGNSDINIDQLLSEIRQLNGQPFSIPQNLSEFENLTSECIWDYENGEFGHLWILPGNILRVYWPNTVFRLD